MSKSKNILILNVVTTSIVIIFLTLRIAETQEYILSKGIISDFLKERLIYIIVVGLYASLLFNYVINYNILKVLYKLAKQKIHSRDLYFLFSTAQLAQTIVLFFLPIGKELVTQLLAASVFSIVFFSLFLLLAKRKHLIATKNTCLFTGIYLLASVFMTMIGSFIV